VEEVRTDVRVLNTSLLGTDWYIDQMKYQMYDSPPLPFSLPRSLYVGSNNDTMTIEEMVDGPISLSAVMNWIADPKSRRMTTGGEMVSFMPARKLLVPVNKENAIKYGIVSPKHRDLMLDTIEITLSGRYITKPDMMILDMLSDYQWDRPICFTAQGGDLKMNLSKYMQFDGVVSTLVPMICEIGADKAFPVDGDVLYEQVMTTYTFDRFNNLRMYVDYQNLYTFQGVVSLRNVFAITAQALLSENKPAKAVEVLDRMQEALPQKQFPLNSSLISILNSLAVMNAIGIYGAAGEKEKAVQLCEAFVEEMFDAIALFGKEDTYSEYDFQRNLALFWNLIEVMEGVDAERADAYEKRLQTWAKTMSR
jgi:hypothetical protein